MTRPTVANASGAPAVSVVMCTYNRADLLAGAIESVLAQSGAPAFELLVVDNNSRDRTSEVIAAIAARNPRVRPMFEAQQGLSPARNTAVAGARGAIVAFTDDDVRAGGDWVASIARVFAEHPAIGMAGGKVLPEWPAGAPPAWLTPGHWAPLALVDYGPAPVAVSADRPLCLVGANLAFRREVFDRVGRFEPSLGRVADGIGSLEDHDFLLRCYGAGCQGLYDPRIVIHADVQPDRLRPGYHRRWHAGHGRFHAMMRSASMERSDAGTLLGVPAHLYRQAAMDAASWLGLALRGTGGPGVRPGAAAPVLRRVPLSPRQRRATRRPTRAGGEIAGLLRRLTGRGSSRARAAEARR